MKKVIWERVPYLSALQVCSRQGAIQIHVYLYFYLVWHMRRRIQYTQQIIVDMK